MVHSTFSSNIYKGAFIYAYSYNRHTAQRNTQSLIAGRVRCDKKKEHKKKKTVIHFQQR